MSSLSGNRATSGARTAQSNRSVGHLRDAVVQTMGLADNGLEVVYAHGTVIATATFADQ